MVPRVERQLRVQHPTPYPKLFQEQLQSVRPVRRVDKDQALALDEFEPEDDVEQEELVFLRAADAELREVREFRGGLGNVEDDRLVAQDDALELFDFAGEGGGHEEALIDGGEAGGVGAGTGEDGTDVVGGVAVGEDQVGLVEDEVGDGGEGEGGGAEVGEEARGGGDDDVGSVGELELLQLVALPSSRNVDHLDRPFRPESPAKLAYRRRDLLAQLPRRYQHDRPRSLPVHVRGPSSRLFLQDGLHDRQRVRQGLAGAGACANEDILAGQSERDELRLDGGRMGQGERGGQGGEDDR